MGRTVFVDKHNRKQDEPVRLQIEQTFSNSILFLGFKLLQNLKYLGVILLIIILYTYLTILGLLFIILKRIELENATF